MHAPHLFRQNRLLRRLHRQVAPRAGKILNALFADPSRRLRRGPVCAANPSLPHHRRPSRRKRCLAANCLGLRHARHLPTHRGRRPHLDSRSSPWRRIPRLPRRRCLLRERSFSHVRRSRRSIPHLPHGRCRPALAAAIHQHQSQRIFRFDGFLGFHPRHRSRRSHPRRIGTTKIRTPDDERRPNLESDPSRSTPARPRRRRRVRRQQQLSRHPPKSCHPHHACHPDPVCHPERSEGPWSPESNRCCRRISRAASPTAEERRFSAA